MKERKTKQTKETEENKGNQWKQKKQTNEENQENKEVCILCLNRINKGKLMKAEEKVALPRVNKAIQGWRVRAIIGQSWCGSGLVD